MTELIFKDEIYRIIGIGMDIHKELGGGFLEIVYKDALEYEFKKNNILYEREKQLKIKYKGIYLNHGFIADFYLFDKIILEVKSANEFPKSFIRQTLNYLRASDQKVGLILNFQTDTLTYKRVIN